jgi:hypothetical protein
MIKYIYQKLAKSKLNKAEYWNLYLKRGETWKSMMKKESSRIVNKAT